MSSKDQSVLEEIGASCPACGGPLALVPDGRPPIFRCEGGHLLALENLLDCDLPKGAPGSRELPWLTLLAWETRARDLHRLAGRALREGRILPAADLQETADRIGRWTSGLRGLLVRWSAAHPGVR